LCIQKVTQEAQILYFLYQASPFTVITKGNDWKSVFLWALINHKIVVRGTTLIPADDAMCVPSAESNEHGTLKMGEGH
jgi:hypothetical protein